ncbi:MAG: hypothetical protein HFG65_16250 [Hungatella sp.]|nr:hypothetical protein [Hungatella sp.]
MGKIAEITNAEQERAFDLIREPDALYLCVKCSDSKKHSKIVKIKLSDVLYQVWREMSLLEKRKTFKCFTELVESDSQTA